MAGSLNKVMLIGNVGRDPEMRYIQSGDAVTSFSLATNRRWTGADGQPHDETEWHNIVAWRKLAEQCNEYLNKGRKVYIEGRLQTLNYEKDGVKHYRTEIIADTMLMLDQRPRDDGDGDGNGFGEYSQPRQGGESRQNGGQRSSRSERVPAAVGADDNTIDLDDTPF